MADFLWTTSIIRVPFDCIVERIDLLPLATSKFVVCRCFVWVAGIDDRRPVMYSPFTSLSECFDLSGKPRRLRIHLSFAGYMAA